MLPLVDIIRKRHEGGINQESADGSVPEGFVSNLINCDVNQSGEIKTRFGYKGYAGSVPLRVSKLEHIGTKIILTFQSGQDLSLANIGQGPLIVGGRLPVSDAPGTGYAGDFSNTEQIHYYDDYSLTNKIPLTLGNQTINVSGEITGITTPLVFMGLGDVSSNNDSHTVIMPGNNKISSSTFTQTFDIVNNFLGYASNYYLQSASEPGTSYNLTVSVPSFSSTVADTDLSGTDITITGHAYNNGDMVEVGGNIPSGYTASTTYYVHSVDANTISLCPTLADALAGTNEINGNVAAGSFTIDPADVHIPAISHALSHSNIMYTCLDSAVDAGFYTEVIPYNVKRTSSGDMTFTFLGGFQGTIVLRAAPISNVVNAGVVSGSNTITFPVDSPYNFFQIYENDTSEIGSSYSVLINNISYNALTGEVTIDYFTNSSSDTVFIFWEAADFASNTLEIEDTGGISENYSTTNPAITVWGIGHENIYKDSTARGGQVNFIDNYKTVAEEKLVVGLGGNLYTEKDASEVGQGLLYPSTLLNLSSRVSSDVSIAPLFTTESRTRGAVTDSSIKNNMAPISEISFVSSGVVDITLSFVNKTGNISIGNEISTNDFLTVSLTPHSKLNGIHKILSVELDTATQTVIRVSIPAVRTNIYNFTGGGGRAGVFSDVIPIQANTNLFISGDKIGSSLFDEKRSCLGVVGDSIYIDASEHVFVPAGLLLYGTRTSSILGSKTSAGTPSVLNYVRRDTINFQDEVGQIKSIRTQGDISVSVDSTGLCTTSVDHRLSVGDKINILRPSNTLFSGEFEVMSVSSGTGFSIELTGVTATGTIQGKTLLLHREFLLEDKPELVTISVPKRWQPIESPLSVQALPDTVVSRYFDANDYVDQPAIRSTMAKDVLFMTNADDEILRYDGEHVTRAGLMRWQPALFIQLNTTGSITNDGSTIAYVDKDQSAKWFKCAEGSWFAVGSRIEDSDDGAVYSVIESVDSGGFTFIYVDRAIVSSATTGNISQAVRRRYYARLNMLDAKGNTIASAVTGRNDLVVEFSAARQPRLRFVGLPTFPLLDYDRLELELYRTSGDGDAFYFNNRVYVPFADHNGYIDIIDGVPDQALSSFDNVNTALMGSELGVNWDLPPRAKSITSIGNRLLLGNVKSYPQLDLQFITKPSIASLAAADFVGMKFLLRKDDASVSTTVDNVDIFRYTTVADSGAHVFTISSIADGTGSVDLTIDNPTTLNAGDWVYLYHSAPGTDNELDYAGWHQISVATSASTGLSLPIPFTNNTNQVDRMVVAADGAVPVLIGSDGNYNSLTGNTAISYESVFALRLTNAINASMRVVNTTISGQELFKPFITAHGGGDFAAGSIRLVKPFIDVYTPELVMEDWPSTPKWNCYVDGIQVQESSQHSCSVFLYPSRLAKSYPNYPEIFDTNIAKDINESDGQFVTGVYSFFGDSSFGGSSLGQVAVVFKEKSIYVDDVQNMLPPQQLMTGKIGLTYPYSPVITDTGIIFANDSGVFKLKSNMQVVPISRILGDLWKTDINLDRSADFYGHYNTETRQYKLSYAKAGELFTSEVLILNDNPAAEMTGWATYNNHKACGWVNQIRGTFFAAQFGKVYKVNTIADSSAWMDDYNEMPEQVIEFKAEDFDVANLRKSLASIFVLVGDIQNVGEVETFLDVNLENNYRSLEGPISVASTLAQNKGVYYRVSCHNKKGTHFQVKLVHSGLNKRLVLAALGYRVGAMSDKGIREAKTLNGS